MKGRGLASEVGQAIATRRRAKGLTQAQIAEALGVEKETVSRMETGVISPTLTRLRQIADVLDCPLSELFRNEAMGISEQAVSISEMIHSLNEEERSLVVNFVSDLVKMLKRRGRDD